MDTHELWGSHSIQAHGRPKDDHEAYMKQTVTKGCFMLGIPAAVITSRSAPKTGGCHHSQRVQAHEQCIK